ncbi:DUF2007 domain-containing protein [Pedobacter sp. N36a]|uniref:putative signal transducing protein n=1 Tax=Pedobacter sp. N36a TaxID=2767996 RepID=UPI001656A093|nr:DUF2007 domain-containing protein [Pedobacter sp. N36a]MBC8987112.1 DUF2007 domain-containing protein [Pedobacter sp. N36a]
MENNWTKVFSTEDHFTAEILKQGLLENDIPAVVMNQQDSSYKVFGTIHILVHPDNVDKANAYIKDNEIA